MRCDRPRRREALEWPGADRFRAASGSVWVIPKPVDIAATAAPGGEIDTTTLLVPAG